MLTIKAQGQPKIHSNLINAAVLVKNSPNKSVMSTGKRTGAHLYISSGHKRKRSHSGSQDYKPVLKSIRSREQKERDLIKRNKETLERSKSREASEFTKSKISKKPK